MIDGLIERISVGYALKWPICIHRLLYHLNDDPRNVIKLRVGTCLNITVLGENDFPLSMMIFVGESEKFTDEMYDVRFSSETYQYARIKSFLEGLVL